MSAKIYRPTKTAMQSGQSNTKLWVLEYLPENSRSADPITGWTSNSDTKSQLKLKFKNQDEAETYAKFYKIKYIVIEPQKPQFKKQIYADNFTE